MAQVTTLPVFVYPNSMKFVFNKKKDKDRKDTLKQLMTIYNPYDFSVKYKITGTAPRKYKISNPDGYIDPRSAHDVVVEHCIPTISNCGTIDKFRVNVTDTRSQKITGSYVIDAILLDCDDETLDTQGDFHSINRTSDSCTPSIRQEHIASKDINRTKKTFVLVVAAVALIALVLLPLKGIDEPNPLVPDYLHLSSLSKISLSFLVGAISSYYLFSFHDRS